MKAILHTKYGGPEVLSMQDIEKPTPGNQEVLIRVFATTVNRTDCGILGGKPLIIRFLTGLFKPKNPITGSDFAGKVEAIGPNVRSFKVGDRVWGFDDNSLGTHAEYIVLSEEGPVTTIPDDFSFAEAAASAEVAHYAYNNIRRLKFQYPIKALVNGGTGAIGSAAIQILKYYGAEVTATCRTKDIERVKSLGADEVIDYTQEDFTKRSRKYHYIFDAVGKSTFGKCKRLLLPGGIYNSTELGPGAQNIYLPVITPWLGSRKMTFPIPVDCKGTLFFVKKMIEAGKFKPLIDRHYTMSEIKEAFEYVASGEKTGNVILNIHEETTSN